ncbi:ACD11 homolog protein [Linum perenne]
MQQLRNSTSQYDDHHLFHDSNQLNSSMTQSQTPLSQVADAFEELSDLLRPERRIDNGEEVAVADVSDQEGEADLRLDSFCQACSLVSVLFSCLGLAFKFAESEYVAKVRDLVEASKRFENLHNVVDLDVAKGTVKTAGSHTRNLRRVRQGLDLIRGIFEQFLASDDHSLKDAASTAYSQICAPYHPWAVRAAVYAGMYTLPTRDQLLTRLQETDQSAEKKMKRYIQASLPVIQHIDRLFTSRNISLDW